MISFRAERVRVVQTFMEVFFTDILETDDSEEGNTMTTRQMPTVMGRDRLKREVGMITEFPKMLFISRRFIGIG